MRVGAKPVSSRRAELNGAATAKKSGDTKRSARSEGTSSAAVGKSAKTTATSKATLPDQSVMAGIGDANAITALQAGSALRQVPGLAALEALKSGDARVADVEQALTNALLSNDPRVVKKAARTLQMAESYRRKAKQDKKNYAGTGFQPFPFPRLRVRLSPEQTQLLSVKIMQTRDPQTVDIMLMAAKKGLVRTDPKSALSQNPHLKAMATGDNGRLRGSDGQEAPRGASSFQEEWTEEVVPGMENIKEAIISTKKAGGAGCPYAQGNHAKGIAFDNAEFKVDKDAPEWARDLFGDNIEGGMVRISGSQTDPNQSDQEAHMPGLRIAFPVKGALDGSATQLIDITANTGDTTHAKTAREHTQFTKDISVPKGIVSGLKPVRAAKHVLGAVFGRGKVKERIGAMKNAVEVTDMAMDQKFHEHKFFGRHAFFVGGRYVQVRFEVVEPKNFKDPKSNPDDPNARLNATAEGIAAGGLKLAMFVTEIPEGRPDMVEQEGWKNLPETRLATIDVPAQKSDPHSKASAWFEDVAHIPGGKDKVFHAVGLGRHRVPVYQASGKVRNELNDEM